MPHASRALLTIAGFTLATWATAMDGPLPVPADGVKLEAPTTTSPNIRLVIPAEEIEIPTLDARENETQESPESVKG